MDRVQNYIMPFQAVSVHGTYKNTPINFQSHIKTSGPVHCHFSLTLNSQSRHKGHQFRLLPFQTLERKKNHEQLQLKKQTTTYHCGRNERSSGVLFKVLTVITIKPLLSIPGFSLYHFIVMFPFLVMCQYLCSFTGTAPMLQSSHIHLFMTLKKKKFSEKFSETISASVKGSRLCLKGALVMRTLLSLTTWSELLLWTSLRLMELSVEMTTQSPDTDVLDVISQDGLEVGDEAEAAHANRNRCPRR